MARESESVIVFEAYVDKRGFTQIPNLVLLDPSLSCQARVLYGLFLKYARQRGEAYPGMERLAKSLGVTDRQVRRVRGELERAHLIRTTQRSQTSNLYTILALDRRVQKLKEETAKDKAKANKAAAAKAKKDSTRTSVSATPDRTLVSGHTRTLMSAEEDAVQEYAEYGGRARARPLKRLYIGGKVVAKKRWENTEAVLNEYNQQAGTKLRLLRSDGQPSLAAKRIYKVLRAYPDIKLDEHADIIRRTLASHWWGPQKTPSIGVVYGMGVFEDNITRDPADATANAKQSQDDELNEMLRGWMEEEGIDQG